MTSKHDIWQTWTEHYLDADNPTSLFETDESLTVQYKNYGRNDRRVLKRSETMEALVRKEGRKVIDDWAHSHDTYHGLIYLMYWIENGSIVPLYIGKAGKYGRDNEKLSANLQSLQGTSTGKFARWGDSHYYHIGDLSAVVCNHDKNKKQKYKSWAQQLFADGRQLSQPTYFWTKAWRKDDIGLYHESEVSLEQIESQIIEFASELYPDQLLNDKGT